MKFSKYHGYGNDFIIGTYQEGIDYEKLAIRICDRHTGIGADGLIILKLDNLEMMFYNADGYRGAMCGNGIRCLVKYINPTSIWFWFFNTNIKLLILVFNDNSIT